MGYIGLYFTRIYDLPGAAAREVIGWQVVMRQGKRVLMTCGHRHNDRGMARRCELDLRNRIWP